MKPAFVIYDRANERYMSSGDNVAPIFNTTDEVLMSHMYFTKATALKRAAVLMKESLKYLKQYPGNLKATNHCGAMNLPDLEIHVVAGPTINVVSDTIVPIKKKSGFAIILEGVWSDTPVSYYFRGSKWQIDQALDPSNKYSTGLANMLARGTVPQLWKTEKHPLAVAKRLKPLLNSKFWKLTATVVEYSE